MTTYYANSLLANINAVQHTMLLLLPLAFAIQGPDQKSRTSCSHQFRKAAVNNLVGQSVDNPQPSQAAVCITLQLVGVEILVQCCLFNWQPAGDIWPAGSCLAAIPITPTAVGAKVSGARQHSRKGPGEHAAHEMVTAKLGVHTACMVEGLSCPPAEAPKSLYGGHPVQTAALSAAQKFWYPSSSGITALFIRQHRSR